MASLSGRPTALFLTNARWGHFAPPSSQCLRPFRPRVLVAELGLTSSSVTRRGRSTKDARLSKAPASVLSQAPMGANCALRILPEVTKRIIVNIASNPKRISVG